MTKLLDAAVCKRTGGSANGVRVVWMRFKRERDSRDAGPERAPSTARISPSTSFQFSLTAPSAPAASVTRERIVEEEDSTLSSVTDKEIASALTEFADIMGLEEFDGSAACGALRETSSAHSSTSTLRSSTSSASSRLLRRSRSSTVSFDTPELPHRSLMAPPACSAPTSPGDPLRPPVAPRGAAAPAESPSSRHYYSSAPPRVPVVPAFNEDENPDQGDGWGWYV